MVDLTDRSKEILNNIIFDCTCEQEQAYWVILQKSKEIQIIIIFDFTGEPD